MQIFVDLFKFFINFIITHSFRFISLCSLIEYLVSDYVVSLCNYEMLQNFFEFRSHPYFLLFSSFTVRLSQSIESSLPIDLSSQQLSRSSFKVVKSSVKGIKTSIKDIKISIENANWIKVFSKIDYSLDKLKKFKKRVRFDISAGYGSISSPEEKEPDIFLLSADVVDDIVLPKSPVLWAHQVGKRVVRKVPDTALISNRTRFLNFLSLSRL